MARDCKDNSFFNNRKFLSLFFTTDLRLYRYAATATSLAIPDTSQCLLRRDAPFVVHLYRPFNEPLLQPLRKFGNAVRLNKDLNLGPHD